jgi:DNA-binding transcriptional ArsR family regulator
VADTPAAASTARPLPARVLQDTASTFGLLAATVRLHILWLLASGDHDVSTLAAATDQSVATVSHHLSKLKLAGLVDVRRQGKRRVYVAADAQVIDVVVLAIERRLPEADLHRHARHA